MDIKKGIKNLTRILPDRLFIRLEYLRFFGRLPDLNNPKTYNEKLQWLKLYDRKPEYTMMVDKFEVKRYISKKIGEQYIIPTLGVWDRFEDINFDALPEQFVLKCTHDSGGLVICTDKSKLDFASAKKKINRCLKTNYYWQDREWPYKNVKPRIIAEKYLADKEAKKKRAIERAKKPISKEKAAKVAAKGAEVTAKLAVASMADDIFYGGAGKKAVKSTVKHTGRAVVSAWVLANGGSNIRWYDNGILD